MSGAEMEALIQRVEAAEGPDRELDGEIHGIPSAACCDWDDVPHYTASLDAAASLIPEGYDWILERTNGGLTICARVGHNDPDRNSWGDTPALALCAAALRALLEMEGGDHG